MGSVLQGPHAHEAYVAFVEQFLLNASSWINLRVGERYALSAVNSETKNHEYTCFQMTNRHTTAFRLTDPQPPAIHAKKQSTLYPRHCQGNAYACASFNTDIPKCCSSLHSSASKGIGNLVQIWTKPMTSLPFVE